MYVRMRTPTSRVYACMFVYKCMYVCTVCVFHVWLGLGGGVAGGQQGADARFHSDEVDGQQRAERAGHSRGEQT